MTIPGAIFAAMLTPFKDDASLSVEGVAPLLDFIIAQGVDGVYAGGSTGECVLQSREERTLMLRELADCGRGRCTLIAHVGAAATDDAVALARVAGDTGYQAISAVPPFYYKHAFDDIIDYYRAIVDACDLPLIIYNIPVLTGVEMKTEDCLRLLEDDRIAGMKYTASNLFQFSQLRQAAPDKHFYFGTDEMFIGAAAIGTDGGIGSTYNLIGDAYVGIHRAIEAGDIHTARRLQAKANDLIAILFETGVLSGLKHALNRFGIPVGPCRRPFSPPSTQSLVRLDAWLDDHVRQAAE
ncbi:MAG: N-acetylneuraminate lyase [Hyphomicrobiales bacterium]|nr:N-acetylneuraminate lyase [Hyphomicrobiales bacterium]